MQKRIRGFTCTLTVLFVGYVIAGSFDPNGIRSIAGKPDGLVLILEALALALVLALGVLFVIVWPQTLLASWVVRRFRVPRFLPFALFFTLSSIIVSVFIILNNRDDWLLKYLMLIVYLVVPCAALWRISFRHDHAT
jgi:hypothetical protein